MAKKTTKKILGVENVTKTELNGYITNSTVTEWKYYAITNATAGVILVQGKSANELYGNALNLTTGSFGSYVLSTDTYTTSTQVQSDWNQANNAAVDFIKNKPTIPAAQVNSDWNAVSGLAQILNKPTIPTQYRESFMRNGQNQTFAAGTTRFLPVVGIAGNTLTVAAQAAQKVVKGGTIPSVGFTLGTTQPGTGSMVWTLMRGATIAGLADTAAVITVAANSVAGEYTYTGNITVNDGDYLVWKVVNNASGASGQDYGSWFEILRNF